MRHSQNSKGPDWWRQLTKAFTERSSSKPATIKCFKQTLDSLEACLGANTPIGTVTAEDADHWRAWVARNKKSSCGHSGYRGFVGDHARFRKPTSGQHRIRTCDLHGVNVAL